jgi:hypothetical protein
MASRAGGLSRYELRARLEDDHVKVPTMLMVVAFPACVRVLN